MFIRWWKQYLSDQLIGIDIGPDSIKLLKITMAKQSYRVETVAITPVPTGITLTEKDYPVFSTILDNLFKRAGLEKTQIALAVPRSTVIIKNTTIDARFSASEMESRVWIEANRYFPDLIGDIYLDYNPTGPNAENSQQIDVMLVACRKDQINPYLTITHQAGLTPRVVDVNCYALERALNVILAHETTYKTVALLNLDIALSSLIVSENRTLIFAHDQSYNGRRLINELQDYLNNAEKKPLDPTIVKASLQDEEYTAILKNNLMIHITHGMHFFYSSRPSMVVEQIVLAGDLAVYPNIAAFIQEQLHIPTLLANPFAYMEIAPGVDQKELLKTAPALMVCCGLALSKVKRSADVRMLEIEKRESRRAN